MKVSELVKKLNKRDKENLIYYIDADGLHEITKVAPMLMKDGTSITTIMNSEGGRYKGGKK